MPDRDDMRETRVKKNLMNMITRVENTIKIQKNGRTDLEFDAKRYVKEDAERTRRLVDSGRNLSGDLKRAVDTSTKNRKIPKMDLASMTEQEMRSQINRAMLERQYNDIFNPQKESKGREYASRTLETAGNVLAVTSSALGIALAIKELRGNCRWRSFIITV